jgi:hypothetical protein
LGQLDRIEKIFGEFEVLEELQRRGVHVSIPKIGSRGEESCFGGIQRFYAELRREYCWGNLNWSFFLVLPGGPRRDTEEGGPLCVCLVFLGEYGGTPL